MYDYKYLDELGMINPLLYNELIYELSARNLAGFAPPFAFSTHNLNAIAIL
jgi:hypothetical protein